ncbi:MAG TPA: carbonate dehydratase [Cyclobacteriaceae bacterium]|nr:carbonate dehydratase [Cyclobacteriaceae bacterium]
MKSYEQLLLQNKAWSTEQIERDPEFFTRLSKIQKPEFLWIGCSDSRVPANEITNTAPGEIFVHRNIANLVVNNDQNLMSVLEYAVHVLKVKHVIVCGHYGCGGIKAAMTQQELGVLNQWLQHIKDVYHDHRHELSKITEDEKRADRLTELSVHEQVLNLAKSPIIQRAWKESMRPILHGWVYRLTDGILNPVCKVESESDAALAPIYQYEV